MKYELSQNEYVLSYISHRVMKRNQNFLACATGPPGSGKTYDFITLAEELSELNGVSFDIDVNVVFGARELMQLINSGKLQRGSVIVFEEAGVTYNSREWQSIGNKLLNYLMQTFRHRNYIVLFTMPDFSFVDVGARKLFHARFETTFIDYARNLCYTRPLFLQLDQATGKQYAKFFRVPCAGKLGTGKIKRIAFRLPSPALIKAYERKKKAFTDKLNAEIQQTLEAEGVKEKLTPLQVKWSFCRNDLAMRVVDAAKACKIPYSQGYQLDNVLKSRGVVKSV